MGRLVALETRLLFRERLAWIVLAVAALACVMAVVQGGALLGAQQQGREAFAAESRTAEEGLLKSIAEAEPAAAAVLPRRATLPILAPLPPLADFSAGRVGFEDYATNARFGLREDGMFKRSRLDNPELLSRGGLDLGFVAVVVLPLLLIALGYGIFAADRDSGISRLLLVQQPSPTRLLLARSVPRLAVVLVPLLLSALVLLFAGPSLPGRGAAIGWWLGLTVLLVLFWWAVILLVNSLRVSAESAALSLVALWILFTLVMPAAIGAIAQATNPPPSRFEQIAASRAAELRANSEFENDHPELTDEAAERARTARRAVQIDRDVETALRPLNSRFEEQRLAQQRTVDALSFLSPAAVTASGQAMVAGTDSATWLEFRQAARGYLTLIKSRLAQLILAGQPLTADGYRGLPRFDWRPEPQAPVGPALYLMLLTLLVGGIAFRRFRKLDLG
ncbi:MAG TPA: ABC transporter permease subunit [Allosphingosinicella sp.]|nr:ABC transporter permease subunit [Allosphingosinicella sp.]